MRNIILILVVLIIPQLHANAVEWKYCGNAPHLTRSSLWVNDSVQAKNGVLVLCPGMNGSGEGLVDEKLWVEFAKENGLGLVSLSFASRSDNLYGKPGLGYYYSEQGSGAILLQGIHEIYPKLEKPKLLLYGFSGGAIFIGHFINQFPERIAVWSAYSASLWPAPNKAYKGSPGIVACGEFDSTRYGPTFGYYQQGRREDAHWIWLSLKNTGHSRNKDMERFTRQFFKVILGGRIETPSIRDAETKEIVDENTQILLPALTVWLPNKEIEDSWLQLHHP
jgi:hypothetical protein